MTTLLARNIQTSHSDLAQHITPDTIPTVDLSTVDRLGDYGAAVLMTIDGLVNKQASMVAYIDIFLLMSVCIAVLVPLIFLTKRGDPNAPPPPMSE
jgi:DHA2 family multidrug resistance protein